MKEKEKKGSLILEKIIMSFGKDEAFEMLMS